MSTTYVHRIWICIVAKHSGLQKVTVGDDDAADASRRPVVFVYSGMGSEWAGMGQELMRIHCFRDAMNECAEV